MPVETSYTKLRETLASVLDRVVDHREVVIVRRKRGDVALVAASEWTGVQETAHLLRSPKNAARLLKALKKAQKGTSKSVTVAMLREDANLEHDISERLPQ